MTLFKHLLAGCAALALAAGSRPAVVRAQTKRTALELPVTAIPPSNGAASPSVAAALGPAPGPAIAPGTPEPRAVAAGAGDLLRGPRTRVSKLAVARGRELRGVSELAGRLRERVEDNSYEVYRGLDQYLTLLGADFARRLAALKGHWIDAGAGEAKAALQFLYETELYLHKSYAAHDSALWRRIFPIDEPRRGFSTDEKAIREVLESRLDRALTERVRADQEGRAERSSSFARKPFVTAVSFVADALNMPRQPSGGKFRFLRGRWFLSIPKAELVGKGGKAELITDVFGVFAYDPRPDLVLRRYLDLLADDGAIYLLLGVDNDPRRLSTHRVRAAGGEIGLVEWLKGIDGLEVVEQRNENFGLPPSTALRITRTGKVRVPALTLAGVVEAAGSKKLNPPLRIFVEE